MKGICGVDCTGCELLVNKKCKGCKKTNGCPFGKKCWIAKYISLNGKDDFETLKKEIIDEFNSLKIDGMPKIKELYQLHGSFVNLKYLLPSGENICFLDDNEIYLGNQVQCEFDNDEFKRCFGVLANMSFLMVCEYGENGSNPEIVIYKRR